MRVKWNEVTDEHGVEVEAVVRLNRTETRRLLAVERKYSDCVDLAFSCAWLDTLPELTIWQYTTAEDMEKYGETPELELSTLTSMVLDDLNWIRDYCGISR